jgi:hypothetical protein
MIRVARRKSRERMCFISARALLMKEWLLHETGGEFTPNAPDQFSEFLAADVARWRKVIKETGVRFD